MPSGPVREHLPLVGAGRELGEDGITCISLHLALGDASEPNRLCKVWRVGYEEVRRYR